MNNTFLIVAIIIKPSIDYGRKSNSYIQISGKIRLLEFNT